MADQQFTPDEIQQIEHLANYIINGSARGGFDWGDDKRGVIQYIKRVVGSCIISKNELYEYLSPKLIRKLRTKK